METKLYNIYTSQHLDLSVHLFRSGTSVHLTIIKQKISGTFSLFENFKWMCNWKYCQQLISNISLQIWIPPPLLLTWNVILHFPAIIVLSCTRDGRGVQWIGDKWHIPPPHSWLEQVQIYKNKYKYRYKYKYKYRYNY